MQTFLPLQSFALSAQVLDSKRLGCQRKEAKQILRVLTGQSAGWENHPAVLMWAGYEKALCTYGLFMCHEWSRRQYVDNTAQWFRREYVKLGRHARMPYWLGNEALHSSHRAALLFKNPEHYVQFNWPEIPEIAYWWPVDKEEKNEVLEVTGGN